MAASLDEQRDPVLSSDPYHEPVVNQPFTSPIEERRITAPLTPFATSRLITIVTKRYPFWAENKNAYHRQATGSEGKTTRTSRHGHRALCLIA